MNFEELVKNRYAVKIFDINKKVSADDLHYVIEMARLAPTSFGLQPFRIKVVSDQAVKEKLQEASWDQPQITTCSHLLVFCADNNVMNRIESLGLLMNEAGLPADKKDVYMGMMKAAFQGKTPEEISFWASKQAYLAADHAMLAAVEKGFNSCPMEGFDSVSYGKILGLPKNLIASIIVPIGYPTDKARPKMRFSKDDILV
jgi:nitroreductase